VLLRLLPVRKCRILRRRSICLSVIHCKQGISAALSRVSIRAFIVKPVDGFLCNRISCGNCRVAGFVSKSKSMTFRLINKNRKPACIVINAVLYNTFKEQILRGFLVTKMLFRLYRYSEESNASAAEWQVRRLSFGKSDTVYSTGIKEPSRKKRNL